MANWNDHPYSAEGYLWIMQPRVVFRARLVAPAPAYPLAQIDFNDISYGSTGDLRMGMLMALGSAPGKFDYGMNYVRGDINHDVSTASTLNVGYCSRGYNRGELNLVDGAYITVWDCYPPFKRPSRMVSNGGVYKDYDWGTPAYTSPVAHVGDAGGLGNMAFVDDTGYFPIQFEGGTSYPSSPVSGNLNFSWTAEDGTFVIGNGVSPNPKIKFPTGYRNIRLVVTDDHAGVSLPREYLVVALSGRDDPTLIRTVSKATWALKPEGVTFQAEVRQRLDPALYLPGSPVMFLVKEKYRGVPGSLTGFEVKFAGYLQYASSFGRSTPTDFERGQTIYAVDAALWLATEKAMPATMARTTGIPLNQNALQAANIDRFVWWYLFNYTNAPMLSDFYWSETSDDYAFSNFSSPGGNLYNAGDNLSRGIAHRLTSDSRGRLRMKPDPQRLNLADRTDEVLADLGAGDWTEVKRVKRPLPRIGVMRSTFTLVSTTAAADVVPPVNDVNGISPGIVEGQANSEGMNGYPWLAKAADDGQDGFDRLGHDYERQNAPEDNLQVKLAHGGDNGLEPAAMAWIRMSIGVNQVIGLDDELDAERCLLLQTTFTFDDDAGTLTQSLLIERETVGTPAALDPRPDTGIVPTTVTITDPVLHPVTTLPPYTSPMPPIKLTALSRGTAKFARARSYNPALSAINWDSSYTLTANGLWFVSDTFDYARRVVLTESGIDVCDDIWAASPAFASRISNATLFGGAFIGHMNLNAIWQKDWNAALSGTNVISVSQNQFGSATPVSINGLALDPSASFAGDNFCSVSINSREGGRLWAIAPDPSNTIRSALFHSTNGGLSWSLVSVLDGGGGRANGNYGDFGRQFIEVPYSRSDGSPNIEGTGFEIWFFASGDVHTGFENVYLILDGLGVAQVAISGAYPTNYGAACHLPITTFTPSDQYGWVMDAQFIRRTTDRLGSLSGNLIDMGLNGAGNTNLAGWPYDPAVILASSLSNDAANLKISVDGGVTSFGQQPADFAGVARFEGDLTDFVQQA